MKKRLLAAILSATMVIGLTACGSSQSAAPAAPATPAATEEKAEEPAAEENAEEPAAGDVTISFMASQDWVQDAELELAEKFTEHTGIKVDYQIIPSDQYANLLMTKINTGECTDIFGGQSGQFDIVTQFNVEKNAVDLSGESWAGNVDQLAAAELTAGGKLYGQPIQDVSAVWAIAYNKTIFADLGLSVPKDYASFMDACDKIAATGVTPVYEAVSDGWHHVLWFPETCVAVEAKAPGTAAKYNNNEGTFAENETMKLILSQMNEMIAKGYWGEDYMSNEYANAAQEVADGNYAMVVANEGFGEEVEAIGAGLSKDDIGYFVIPLADNQTMNVNPAGPSRFIYSGSEHQAEAKQYLEFLASEESLTYLTENVPKFNKLPFSNAPAMYEGSVKEFYDTFGANQGTVYQTAVKYVNPQWMEIGADLSAMFLGEMTEDEVLANIDKLRAEQAAAASDPAWN